MGDLTELRSCEMGSKTNLENSEDYDYMTITTWFKQWQGSSEYMHSLYKGDI